MSRSPSAAAVLLAGLLVVAPAGAGDFGLGRQATPEEIAGWDIDVRPDGQGLPDGKGSVAMGETIFADKCASCHGDFAEGVGRWPVLAGGHGTLKNPRPVKTVGSYWPYLSTLFDFIARAKPFGDAKSLKSDEVYAITAFLLHMNDIVDADFELTRQNFTSIRLPNEAQFTDDPRPDTPGLDEGTPCMKDCKVNVEITMRARALNVTPAASE
ncbi:MAG: cytochrome c [Rhizobiales bacterium]|nr:cytochrome c [Hyphomicrobiales bacterium]